jgi:hypothetical protein
VQGKGGGGVTGGDRPLLSGVALRGGGEVARLGTPGGGKGDGGGTVGSGRPTPAQKR